MARSRNIKPGFFTNDELAELPALTRLMFIGLWTIVDRDGRVEDRPKKIKAETMPYDDMDCDKALQSLADAGFIERYVADGVKVIQVCNWDKHQNPHVKEQPSSIPAPVKHQTSTVQVQDMSDECMEVAGLIPDSGFLIPDSLNIDSRDSVPVGTDAADAAVQPAGKQVSAKAMAAEGVDKQIASDWLILRKAKRLPLTATAWDTTKQEGEKVGLSPAETVAHAVKNNWAGFRSSWYLKDVVEPVSSQSHGSYV